MVVTIARFFALPFRRIGRRLDKDYVHGPGRNNLGPEYALFLDLGTDSVATALCTRMGHYYHPCRYRRLARGVSEGRSISLGSSHPRVQRLCPGCSSCWIECPLVPAAAYPPGQPGRSNRGQRRSSPPIWTDRSLWGGHVDLRIHPVSLDRLRLSGVPSPLTENPSIPPAFAPLSL
jgi:hypothetical protein